jgi:methyl acetate hydrolase
MNRRHFVTAAVGLGVHSRDLWGEAANGSPGKIDDTLRAEIARRKIPAAVGMAATRRTTLYAGAFGKRDAEGTPVTMDSIFGIASMTKAITTVAAMQLVEQGKVKLEEPVSKYLPQLDKLDVLQGFEEPSGKPILRPAKTAITLKHLVTHTSGLCDDLWDEKMFRFTSQSNGSPAGAAGPLMFEPGQRWQYGPGVYWTGRLVEKISGMSLEDYFQARILGPLEMRDTSYLLPPAKFDRLVGQWHRDNGGELIPDPRKQPAPPKTFNGSGGLYSTAADYVRFMQMILGKGRGVNNAAILEAKTVASMEVNQIGKVTAGKMRSYRPNTSSDVDVQPGFTEKWGLGFLINTTAYAGGRAAGSLAWAGLHNTFYWIDLKRGICAVLLMQFLPFVDKEAVGLLGDFERAVYANVRQ